ncbi:hypothetical protein GCM10023174_00810 [Chelativorans composti]|jgi:hypothetical protein|uniref:Helix-turn-helix transcriptional regulator n=1 Tax=Chelativorans composti TaxID=768533 RepID=A0ABW5DCJ6_9HYPH
MFTAPASCRLLNEEQRRQACEELQNLPHPPWRPIPSREVCRILGVSLQSLANWRVRGTGPEPEPHIKGNGNRTYYRPDKILAWLSDHRRDPWEFSRDWLAERGVEMEPASQASIEWLIEQTDSLL